MDHDINSGNPRRSKPDRNRRPLGTPAAKPSPPRTRKPLIQPRLPVPSLPPGLAETLRREIARRRGRGA